MAHSNVVVGEKIAADDNELCFCRKTPLQINGNSCLWCVIPSL